MDVEVHSENVSSHSPASLPPLLPPSWWTEQPLKAADCGEGEQRRTDLVGVLLHQLPNFAGAAVRRLDDQPAGIVLLRGLRQQLLQHRDDRA